MTFRGCWINTHQTLLPPQARWVRVTTTYYNSKGWDKRGAMDSKAINKAKNGERDWLAKEP
jgi:hypothetical protein